MIKRALLCIQSFTEVERLSVLRKTGKHLLRNYAIYRTLKNYHTIFMMLNSLLDTIMPFSEIPNSSHFNIFK